MKTIDLEALSDEELAGVIRDAQALTATRDKAKKDKAIEDAKATLAAVGLSFRDVLTRDGAGKKRGRPPGSKSKPPLPPGEGRGEGKPSR